VKKKLPDIYVSTDIEADGHLPGKNSMLSFAAAALDIDRNIIKTFSRNLNTLPYAEQCPETMKFWARFPEAYARTRENCIDPAQAFIEFRDWCNGLKSNGPPIFMVYPGRFDMRFIDWYSLSFIGESLLGRSSIDLKSYAYATMKIPFRRCIKRNFPKKWFTNRPHTHIAIDDAIEQGELGVNMIRHNLGMTPII